MDGNNSYGDQRRKNRRDEMKSNEIFMKEKKNKGKPMNESIFKN